LFKILIDSCVWLDLAKDYQQQAILAALEELIRHGEVELLLPRTSSMNSPVTKRASSRRAAGTFPAP
jgi:hypothetical protein